MKSILRLKEVLEEKGISVKEFASKVGLSYTYCTEIIRGDKFPRQDTLVAIADSLDVDIRALFRPTKDTEPIHLIISNELKTFQSIDELIEYLKTIR